MSPASPAPTSDPAPGLPADGALDFVFSVPAQDAIVVGERVITIDPDFKSLSGYSTVDGRWQWKTQTDSGHGGRHTLSIRKGSVVFWAGNRVFRVDPATGAVSPPIETPWNGNCGWVEEGSACAYHCDCHFTLTDCSTGKPIGQDFQMSRIEFHHLDGESSSSCSRWGVGLVTGVGRVAIVTAEDSKSKPIGRFRLDNVVLGLDAVTGNEIWRSSDLVVMGGYERAGAGPDGKTCWGASRDGDILVFDCARGSILWKKPGKANDTALAAFVSYVPERGGIFRLLTGTAELFDLRSGAILWKKQVPTPGAAIPVGAVIGYYDILADKDAATPLLILRPSDGAIERRVTMPAGSGAHRDPAGGFYVLKSGEDLAAYDAAGQERWRMAKPNPLNPGFHEDFFGLYSGERIALFDRKAARPLGELAGSIGVQPGSSLQNGILLYRFAEDKEKAGQAIFARAAVESK